MDQNKERAALSTAPPIAARRGMWGRQLDRYPDSGPRAAYLAVVVLVTITLYYELYVGGSVTPLIAAQFHMSLRYLVGISIAGNAVGALSSVFAGLADRWGRANLVVYGLAITGAVTAFGYPAVTNRGEYLTLTIIVSFVEGVILVATPALVRDFTPQLGRATAMSFWMLGPVLGSLTVSEIASHTLTAHADWQFQFRLCGVVGLVVFVVAFLGLRELAPRLRDQLMVSVRDKALIEARARGLDPEAALSGHWRQMMRRDIVIPSVTIGVSNFFYYSMVGLFVVFFSTNFGYTGARANALSNWYWGLTGIALLIAGALSDLMKVRKPFILIGAVTVAVGIALFAEVTTRPHTSYYTFVGIFAVITVGGAFASMTWAAFTETIEKHNPAATATGLAVLGAALRSTVVAALVILIGVVPAANRLVDQGPTIIAAESGRVPGLTADQNATVAAVAADPTIATRVQRIASSDAVALAAAAKLTPATAAALAATPTDPAVQAHALSQLSGLSVADVTRAMALEAKDGAQLATLAVIDPTTLAALAANSSNGPAQATAVAEISKAFGIGAADAGARLAALGTVPEADLAFMVTEGRSVATASSALQALGKVPAADLALVTQYGPGLKDPKVVAELAYLQANAPALERAQARSPREWQHWWWICFAAEILFLPSIWLLAGRWSPAKAKADALAHDEAVRHELAGLASPEGDS